MKNKNFKASGESIETIFINKKMRNKERIDNSYVQFNRDIVQQ